MGEEYPFEMLLYGRFCDPGEGLKGGAELGTLPGLGDESQSSLQKTRIRSIVTRPVPSRVLLTPPSGSFCWSSRPAVVEEGCPQDAAGLAAGPVLTVRF